MSMDFDKELNQKVSRILHSADEKIKERDWKSANDLLRKGLIVLGSSYFSPDTIDETGMKLVLADSEERNGNLEGAAKIRRRILENRQILYQTQSANVNESSKYIGAATMEENGDIVMTLRAESEDSPIIGDAQFRYKPGSPGYADVLRHLGGLRPGETKPVLPWPNNPQPDNK